MPGCGLRLDIIWTNQRWVLWPGDQSQPTWPQYSSSGPIRGEYCDQLTNHSSPDHNTHPLDQSEVSIVASWPITAHLGLNGDEAADGEEEQWSDHVDSLPGSEELWMAALVIMCHRKQWQYCTSYRMIYLIYEVICRFLSILLHKYLILLFLTSFIAELIIWSNFLSLPAAKKGIC